MRLAVAAGTPDHEAAAGELARRLAIPLLSQAPDARAVLEVGDFGLHLRPRSRAESGPVTVDFASAAMRHRRRGGQNELLGRAVGVNKRERGEPLRVVDATAGLGRDAFVLADLGCRVTMLERVGALAALLEDGLRRARQAADPWLDSCVGRLCLVHTDARQWLAEQPVAAIDVVYMDPMFPGRRKSARAKKEMWLFQQVVEHSDDAVDLLTAALDAAAYRVVVKRPLKGPPLDERPVAFALRGRSVRFDVYTRRKLE